MTDASPRAPFWLGLISGADNRTPAIGRLLGAILFVNLLLVIPGVIVAALWARRVEPQTWFSLLGSLGAYVPLCAAAVGGIVAGTNFTEPKPPRQEP
jgi:hypothetical protein